MSQNWPTMWGIVDIDADSHRVIMKVESHDGITTIRPQIAPGVLGDLCAVRSRWSPMLVATA